jgi:hypothetical protein
MPAHVRNTIVSWWSKPACVYCNAVHATRYPQPESGA